MNSNRTLKSRIESILWNTPEISIRQLYRKVGGHRLEGQKEALVEALRALGSEDKCICVLRVVRGHNVKTVKSNLFGTQHGVIKLLD